MCIFLPYYFILHVEVQINEMFLAVQNSVIGIIRVDQIPEVMALKNGH